MSVHPSQEKTIKIEKLYIYPCRGINGIEVDQIKVSNEGIKYDREWALVDKEKKKPLTQVLCSKLAMLRQKIEKVNNKRYLVVRIADQFWPQNQSLGITQELRIEMDMDPQGEVITNEKFTGHLEGKQSEDWISTFLGRPTQFVRNRPNTIKQLNRSLMIHSYEDDRSKNMVSKAAIHIINEASIRHLKEKVMEKYPEEERDAIKIEHTPFRPNILIDSGKEFTEDSMDQVRIGSILLRLVGYCSRCKAVSMNMDTCDYNPELEPNYSLGKFRKHKELGVLFGTYFQVDVIPSNEAFKKLLPNYPEIKDRQLNKKYGIVKRGDDIKIRVDKLKVKFD